MFLCTYVNLNLHSKPLNAIIIVLCLQPDLCTSYSFLISLFITPVQQRLLLYFLINLWTLMKCNVLLCADYFQSIIMKCLNYSLFIVEYRCKFLMIFRKILQRIQKKNIYFFTFSFPFGVFS